MRWLIEVYEYLLSTSENPWTRTEVNGHVAAQQWSVVGHHQEGRRVVFGRADAQTRTKVQNTRQQCWPQNLQKKRKEIHNFQGIQPLVLLNSIQNQSKSISWGPIEPLPMNASFGPNSLVHFHFPMNRINTRDQFSIDRVQQGGSAGPGPTGCRFHLVTALATQT